MQDDTKRAIKTLTEATEANTRSISAIIGQLKVIGDTRPSKAAPDLLAACRALLGVLERLPLDHPLISDAHTACKQARVAMTE